MELEKLVDMNLGDVLRSGSGAAEMANDVYNWLSIQVGKSVEEGESEEWGYRDMLRILINSPSVTEDLAVSLLLIGVDTLVRNQATFLRTDGAGNQAGVRGAESVQEGCVQAGSRSMIRGSLS